MWDFISANAQVLTLCITAATLVVWTVYGQLMAKGLYRSQLPRLFLKQAGGRGLQSRCYLANMGLESAYLRSVFIDMQTADGHARGTVNAYQPASDEEAGGGYTRTGVLGPVQGNAHISLGRFSDLLESSAFDAGLTASRKAPVSTINLQRFTVTAILNYGPDEKLIGAVRDFSLDSAGERVGPTSVDTTLLKGWPQAASQARPSTGDAQRLLRPPRTPPSAPSQEYIGTTAEGIDAHIPA